MYINRRISALTTDVIATGIKNNHCSQPHQSVIFSFGVAMFSCPSLAGIEEQLTQNKPEPNRFFYHPDHLGSPTEQNYEQ
jgi:hypothetical protein